MKSKIKSVAAAIFLLGCLESGGALAVDYNEAVDGDLSGNGLLPTVLALGAGSNLVVGNFGGSPLPGVQDLDYLSVIVPTGYVLNKLMLTSLVAGGANSFLGVQSGPQVTMPPTSFDPSPLLGYNHIFTNQEGTNLLPSLGISGGLAAGSYTFWINETDTTQPWSYGFDFQVAAVPEPETYAMLLAGLGLLGAFVRKRRRA